MKRGYLFEKLSGCLQGQGVLGGLAMVLLLWTAGGMPGGLFPSNVIPAVMAHSSWDITLPIALILVMFGLFFAARPFLRSILKRLEPQYPTVDAFPMNVGKRLLGCATMLLFLAVSTTLQAQSGTAFRDFNGDGLQTGAEPGVEGINVRLFSNAPLPAKDQLIGTAVTNASGVFNFAVALTSGRAANAGELVRIEFEIPNSFECSLADNVDFEALAGAVYGTSVQFITGQQSGIKFAINYPGQWVENPNPDVYLPCYAFGNPDAAGNNVADDPAFIKYKFLDNGVPASHSGGTPGVPDPTALANVGEVGSLYGVAYSRTAKVLFTSAVIRRHCGLGPLGPGGIYLIDPSIPGSDKTTDFLNLDAIGIHTWDHSLGAYPPNPGDNTSPVTGYVGSNTERGLPGDRYTPSTDYAAGDQVGKVSIGDIDISDDGRYLYVMNLWDRKIYEIDLVDARNPQAPTLADVPTRVRSWPAPDPGTISAQGEHRPWGLKYYRGKLYVGVVLSGQNLAGNVVSPIINGNGAEIRGYVYEFNPATQIFSAPLLDFSFSYGRERPWIPWGYRAGFPSRYFSGTEREIAEPIIADIEFDDQGNILVGVMDRKGHQYAINTNNYAGTLVDYEYSTAGELLRANASIVNGSCVYDIVTRPGTADYYNDNLWHSESVQGPLAVLPGGGEALAVWLDPIKIRSGGTIRLNNTSGAQVANSAYEVFDDRFTLDDGDPFNEATASKANGLGDVELSGETAPVEIGNRIWADMDGDGVQDSGEPGIPGVKVQLKTPAGVLLTTVLSNVNGNYFFTALNVPDGDPGTPGNQPGPQPNFDYKICIPVSEFGDGKPLNNFLVTPPDQNGTGLVDYSDSDGILLGNGDVQIMVTTGDPGQNDYTLDFGIIPTDYGDLPNTYGTTEGSNGPWHWVSPSLKLGACVDGEINGQPETMAGFMTGGDDNTVGLAQTGTCTGNGDDESGIVFESPMIPGAEACLRITAMNMTGAPAVLQGWIDFNGNGAFETGEQLTTGDFAPSGAAIPAGGVSAQLFCFTVPATATFQGGAAFSRFRLSQNGGLGTGGAGDFGEVEDYKTPLAKVGTLVWNDYDNNGVQNETATAGINGVPVNLTWLGPDGAIGGGDDVAYVNTTANMGGTDGTYMFLGLVPGMYKVAPSAPAGYISGQENLGGNDLKDGDNHAGEMVVINNPINLITGENGTGDVPGGTNGFPDTQDNLSFDFNYVAVDYGDLPNTYGTTTGSNGPSHTVNPNLKLGASSDGDPDGQPDSMAGAMTGGDDNDADGDDEDGIAVSGPMIPGAQACFTVNAMNMTGAPAILQAWVDFNGDGQFQPTEQLSTGAFAPAGATVPAGGLTDANLCFTVPVNATFQGGQAMMRFRLSPAGGLLATGILSNGQIPTGEVEDYKISLAKVGTYVWNDYNNNGQQDEPGTAGLNGITVNLTWLGPNGAVGGGDDVTYTTTTSTMNATEGQYMILGLTSGMYKLSIPTVPATFAPTLLNAGSDITDADDPTGVMVVIPNPVSLPVGENGTGDTPGGTNGFPDAQDDLTYDFGYIQRDYGDLPDTYGTTTGSNGPSHVVDPSLKLGACVDAENNGIPEAMAGAMTGGDDNTGGANVDGATSTCGDDEDGVVFVTPFIPGYESCVKVTAMNATGAAATLQAWIDFNGNGSFDASEQLSTGSFAPSGANVPVGGLAGALLCFDVPPSASFQGGKAMVRFRLSQNGGLTPTGADGNGEVEDYKVNLAKIGNLVWTDYNNDGQQNEPLVAGIDGTVVQLVYGGADGDLSTLGDNITYTTTTATMTGTPGIYMFYGLISGNYKVSIPTPPNGAIPTMLNLGNDVTDSDDPAGAMVSIPNPIGLPLGENGTGDNPGGTNGFPDAQDNLTIDFGYVGFDYGDLPNSYNTSTSTEGPKHVVTPDLYLGTCVDSEEDAFPDPMAGLMGAGDDGNPGTGTQGVCAIAGDDENGIVFETPLVPGVQACIRVTAHNNTDVTAKLQGWIDFNGNGSFEAGEQLTTGDFAPAGANVPDGGLSNVKLCFTVPVNATFQGGQAMVRFRLSKTGGLAPGNPVGTTPTLGEVEDYKVPLAKTGNLVWWDYDNDGIQEAGEPGINGANVQLTFFGPNGLAGGGDDVVYTTTTATMNGEQGVYMFLGLVPGMYKASIVNVPVGFLPTLLNQGSDVTDADDPAGVMVVIPDPINLPTGENGNSDNPGGTNGFADNQDNLTYDFGYIAVDYGDAPNTYGTNNNGNGAVHLLNPNLYLGTCIDGDNDGQPDPMAGLMSGGDDNNNSQALLGICAGGDDENGVVSFETPLIPGYPACVRVTAVNTTGSAAVLQGWIDFNGNGTFEANEQLTTGAFAPAGAGIPNGGVVNMQFCFDVPANAVFANGNAFSRFRLSPTGGLAPTGPVLGSPLPIGEVEDYKTPLAKIGNLVWNDWDNNGQQNEPGNAGLNNIEVHLIWAGTDLAFNTPDDRTYETVTASMTVAGQYMFWGLIPGLYKVVLPNLPANFIPTQLNVGSDVSDSDTPAGEMVMIPDPIALPTGENSTGDVPNDFFPDPQNNITIDFGLITRDFGDLPDTYGTTDGSLNDGPVHVVNPNLKLGACEDGELDGNPDSMAGLMTGGDDNTGGAAVDGTASTCGDDEDGIVFESPMVPGTAACIRVTAMNMLTTNAVLQMWIDFNGDGDVADAGEAVTSGAFNGPGGGAIVPVGGLSNAQMCFDVPASATFAGGSARVRFRISPVGGLSPNGPENMPFPVGETEDYKLPVAKIGNYVWNDNNNDGIQNEPGSNGLNNIVVQLVWAGPDADFGTTADNRTYTTLTAAMNGVNGQYMFWGLPSGAYKVSVPTNPTGFIPTQINLGSDVLDADDPAGVMVMIPNPINLPVNENGTGDQPGGFNNYPDNQDDLTLDFGYVSVDYGDLPNTYGTTIGSNGPKHIVNPNLKLGASVDGELDGQPEAMAGMLTGGDDGTNGGYNEGGAGDDENGVTFLTPMVPGFQACVRVNTMNTLGGNAVLQAWIDFNGDGDVNDAGEQLNTGSFAAAAPGAIVPAGASVNSDFCFDVPATATFFGGNAFARFRLSPTGGLTVGGPATMPYPIGEVEDYKVQLAKAGNLVWIDANVDGLQTQPLEIPLGINGVTVELQWAGPDGNFGTTIDNRTYTDVTSTENGVQGKYLFCGMIPGNYRMVVPPFGYVPTLIIDAAGNTQDVIDADNPAGVLFTVPNPPTTLPTNENGIGDNPLVINGFPDNQANFTFDFGYLGFDFGDLPETYGTTQGAGNPGPDGAVHTVTPDLYLGPCVDIDIDGQPEAMAGFMTGGDDGNAGPGALGTCTPLADDENGISFPTPLIPGNTACVKVTARNNTGGAAFLQAWIDFNGNGTFETTEQLTTGNFAPAGASIPNGGVTAQNFCFDVPATATFNGGNLFARFRLSKNGGVNASGPAIPGNGVFPNGEVEDYKLPLALIGNYVWMDNPDIEGDQDASEMPLANVKVNLTWPGEDGIYQTAATSGTPSGDDRVYMTTTDATGRYEFRGLIPTTNYRILPNKYTAPNGIAGALINPVNKILTIPNLVNDNLDSDGTPLISVSIPNLTTTLLPTGENGLQDNVVTGFPDNQANVSLDFGFIDEPEISAAMAITGFDATVCGEFAVWMDICIKNTSTTPLANIQAMLDLAGANAYGTAFKGVIGSAIVVSSTAQQNPVFNNGFNGAGTAPGKNLLDGVSGLLWPGEEFCFRIKFGVDPDFPGAPANPKSQAMVSGKAVNFQGIAVPDYWNGGAQYMAMDLSDVGNDPMSSNPGYPGDTGGVDDPTTLGNCWQTTQNQVCNDFVNVSIDADCSALLTPSMLLEGEDPNCDEDNYPLGTFQTVTITTLQGVPVPNPVPQSFLGQTLKYSVKHIMSCNSCWGTFKIEDKQAPVVVCEDIHLNCAISNYAPAYLDGVLGFDAAYPTITDCANFTSNYVDTWHDLACNEGFNGVDDLSAYVERKWQVTDQWGNASSCTQYIYFHRLHVTDVHYPEDAIVSCSNGNADPAVTGTPYVEFNGQEWALWPNTGFCEMSVTYTDARIPVCDGTYKIERTWRAHDWCLPTSPFPPLYNPFYYIQIITVMDNAGPEIACPANLTVSTDPFKCCATVDLPDALITDNCSRVNNISAMIITHEYYTGVPGPMLTADGVLSDFPGNNWWDRDTLGKWGWTPCLPLGTHSVTYLAQDDCGNTAVCAFELTVADLIPPVAACDQTTTVGLGFDDPYDCYTPADGCDGAGVTWVPAANFDDGSYDECSQLKFTVRRMAPYSDCINNLSHDPCYPGGLSEFELATAELDSIKFYCCEVGSTETVILRVYQVDVNGDYVNGIDGTPLFNECMIQVEVQDKIKPVCQSPANITVTCEQFDPSLWLYGKASILDNCCLDTTKVYQGQCGLTHTVNYAQFDTLCNKGTITRTFRAFDCHGQSSQCTQRIVVTYEQDYYVRFPNDVIVTVCDGTGNYGEPTFFGEDCELLGVSYEDEIFTVVPDACFKIERNWKIINWCTYNPNLVPVCIDVPNPNPNTISNHPTNLPGPIVSPIQTIGDPWKSTIVKINPSDALATNYSIYYDPNANCYTYKQIIKIIDTQDPVVQCPASPATICDVSANDAQLWNESYWWDNQNQSHDLCEAPSDICITATDACSGANINIEYQLFLDLDGDGTMETVVNSTQLGSQTGGLGWNNILYGNFTGAGTSRQFDGRPVPTNQKWGFAIQETVTGANKTACVKFNTFQAQNTYVTPQLPYGNHKIKWFVSDGCGNETICEYSIIVKDCKAPTVVCLNGLSVNIMPTGMIQLWATDFLQYAEDNCTQTQYLKYGIRKCGQGTGFPVDAQGNPITNVTFDCSELGTQCVELWAIDLAGNADYCETYVIVQDNAGNCPSSDHINVSGALKTEVSEGVEEGNVNITGSVNFAPPFSYFDLTDNQGAYAVMNSVPLAAAMTISPVKDDNPLNGVTTYDLVLMSKHILGIAPLSTPYQMIAADANKSNSITTFDIVELRKLILGIYQELPNNTSWRFVEKSYNFPNPANPFMTQFPEDISVAQAMTHQFGDDFVGVKIGDVNNTVIANSLMAADDRSAGTLLFDVSDRDVKAGDVFDVTFKAGAPTAGYQMTLNLNGLAVSGIVHDDHVTESNFGVFADAMTVSINDADAFTVKFRATKSGRLSDMMKLSGKITKAEAYSVADLSAGASTKADKLDVALRFGSPAGMTIAGIGFELYQNQPNPFVNKTMIGFHLPEAAAATLTVYDETGRLVYSQKGDFAAGYNVFMIERQLIGTNGALWYRVETATDSATRTMIQTK